MSTGVFRQAQLDPVNQLLERRGRPLFNVPGSRDEPPPKCRQGRLSGQIGGQILSDQGLSKFLEAILHVGPTEKAPARAVAVQLATRQLPHRIGQATTDTEPRRLFKACDVLRKVANGLPLFYQPSTEPSFGRAQQGLTDTALPSTEHAPEGLSVAFRPDGRALASSGADLKVWAWAMADLGLPPAAGYD